MKWSCGNAFAVALLALGAVYPRLAAASDDRWLVVHAGHVLDRPGRPVHTP